MQKGFLVLTGISFQIVRTKLWYLFLKLSHTQSKFSLDTG